MATLTLQDIKTEGNSIIITSYPITGVLALVGLTEVIQGQDATHSVIKTFRYTIDGVSYSEWLPLTVSNLTSLNLEAHHIVKFELNYFKQQPLGSDQLTVQQVDINYTQTTDNHDNTIFNKTIFYQFFESNHTDVLNWYINVLNKLYKKGLIPDYLDRNIGGDDSDFLQFWSSIAKFFAYYVIYARRFQNFHQSESLLFEFLEQRGMYISDSTTLDQMNELMNDYNAEIAKRGTINIVNQQEDGYEVDGELLRLLYYRRKNDEFLFNPRLPQHIGWSLGNSSPLNRDMLLNENLNKFAKLITNGQINGIDSVIQEDGRAVAVFQPGSSFTHTIALKVDGRLDYQLFFETQTAGEITVSVAATDSNNMTVQTYSQRDGAPESYFLKNTPLYRSDRFLPVKLLLHNYFKPTFTGDTTEIHQGQNLRMHKETVWVEITISSTDLLHIDLNTLRFVLLKTRYSHGLIQTNNVVDMLAINNNDKFTFTHLYNRITRYLIPYSSHLIITNINDFGNIDNAIQIPIKTTKWIGGQGYCETVGWRGIEPFCEKRVTKWIPEEETSYCEIQQTTTTTTVPPTTTTTTTTTRPFTPIIIEVEENTTCNTIWAIHIPPRSDIRRFLNINKFTNANNTGGYWSFTPSGNYTLIDTDIVDQLVMGGEELFLTFGIDGSNGGVNRSTSIIVELINAADPNDVQNLIFTRLHNEIAC